MILLVLRAVASKEMNLIMPCFNLLHSLCHWRSNLRICQGLISSLVSYLYWSLSDISGFTKRVLGSPSSRVEEEGWVHCVVNGEGSLGCVWGDKAKSSPK